MKGKIKYIVIAIIILPICLWLGSLAKCEVLTHIHYDEFRDKQINSDYFKVLKYSHEDIAEVYYITKNYTLGKVLRFKYNPDTKTWEELDYITGWSTEGNADNLVYPYLWHFKYFAYEH